MEGFLFCFSLILTLGPLQGRHVSACVQRNFQLLFVTRSSFGKAATSWQCGPTTARGPCNQPNLKQKTLGWARVTGSPGLAYRLKLLAKFEFMLPLPRQHLNPCLDCKWSFFICKGEKSVSKMQSREWELQPPGAKAMVELKWTAGPSLSLQPST